MSAATTEQPPPARGSLGEVALLFLKLGCIAFGGPAAHIALLRDEVVRRRRWVTEQQFLDLVGASNLIPGPTSTELAIFLGYLRAGWRGLVLAGGLFVAPAMLIVLVLAWAYVEFGSTPGATWLLYGVKPVIIAVVAQAIWSLGRTAVKGCIVTIDAMGTQREIAKQILDQDGDYVLALKENQGTLYQDVVEMFAHAKAGTIEELVVEDARTIDKGHGRIDVRRYRVIPDADVLAWLQERHKWPGLSAIGMVEAERRIADKRTTETRYYLLSTPLKAKGLGQAVRSHWGIENRVHWVLDVAFHEDHSRIRAGYAAENFAVLRHLALNLLQHHKTKGLSVRTRRMKAAWDNDYLLQVLQSI